ncbi:alpha/beta hydrolase family protein [Natrialbaceae archaeon A-gly3]
MARTHTITIDGEDIEAVHHEADTDEWIVFCHGFLSDKTGSYEYRCERAVEEGVNGVRFDFRGSGDSDGEFREATLTSRLEDLSAVLEYFDPASVVLFGSSFGGKVALHAAGGAVDLEDRLEAVLTRAPVTYNRAFENYRGVVEAEGDCRFDTGDVIDAEFFADFDTYDFENVADGIDVPVAIFHGRRDESVPLEDSLAAAGELETDVTLEAYAREGHRFSREAEDRLLERVFGFLK